MVEAVDAKVLSKVKKLLTLADSKKNGNAEESQNAMMMAQKYMAQHGISMSQVTDFSGGKVEKEVKHEGAFKSSSLVWWQKELAVIIARNFRCKVYIQGGYKSKTIVFLGLKDDAEIASEVYKYAKEAIDYHARAYRKGKKKELLEETGLRVQSLDELESQVPAWKVNELAHSCGAGTPLYRTRLVAYIRENVHGQDAKAIRNDFIKGYLRGLNDKFKEQVERNNWGLVLVIDALVIQEEEKMNLKAGKSSGPVRSDGDREAFAQGYKTGKEFQKPTGLVN